MESTTIAQIKRRLRADNDTTNLLQALASVGVAISIAAAAVLGSIAAGHWQDSLRAEVRWSAAMVLDTSYLYRDEAPWAVEIALMESRADDLESAARHAGTRGDAAMAEAQTLRLAARSLVDAQAEDHLIAGDTYRAAVGFDLGRRLGDLQAQGDVPNSASAEAAAGDRLAKWAVVCASAAIVLVLLYVISHAMVFTRMRRRRASRQLASPDVGLVPHIWQGAGAGSRLGAVAFAAWLLVTLLPVAQVGATLDEQRLQSHAARSAVEVSSMTQASTSFSGFVLSSQREAALRSMLGLSREAWAMAADPNSVDTAQFVLARADQDHSVTVGQLIAAMVEAPTAEDGVDPETVRRLTATPQDWQNAVAIQGSQVDAAESAGQSATKLAVAILLAALALSIATLARTMTRRRQRWLSLTSVTMVTASAILAASAIG